ncbi:UNVERIFIED_CONTAM: hypothetical protein Sindi_1705700 [Sesamum indicum]
MCERQLVRSLSGSSPLSCVCWVLIRSTSSNTIVNIPQRDFDTIIWALWSKIFKEDYRVDIRVEQQAPLGPCAAWCGRQVGRDWEREIPTLLVRWRRELYIPFLFVIRPMRDWRLELLPDGESEILSLQLRSSAQDETARLCFAIHERRSSDSWAGGPCFAIELGEAWSSTRFGTGRSYFCGGLSGNPFSCSVHERRGSDSWAGGPMFCGQARKAWSSTRFGTGGSHFRSGLNDNPFSYSVHERRGSDSWAGGPWCVCKCSSVVYCRGGSACCLGRQHIEWGRECELPDTLCFVEEQLSVASRRSHVVLERHIMIGALERAGGRQRIEWVRISQVGCDFGRRAGDQGMSASTQWTVARVVQKRHFTTGALDTAGGRSGVARYWESIGHCIHLNPSSRERSARVPEGLGYLTGSVGPGWPMLGAETAERLRVMCKVAPRAAGYLGQHLSCEWVIEASI